MSAHGNARWLAVLVWTTLGPGCGGSTPPTKKPGGTTLPVVQVATPGERVAESAGIVSVEVVLDEAATSDVTVPFTVSGSATAGTDYTASASPLVIAAGAPGGTIAITVLEDTLVEPDETVVIGLLGPTNATLGSATTHTLTIADDDVAPVVPALTVAGASAGESSGTLSFTVGLSTGSDSAVSVDFATADGTATAGVDYTATAGTLTFAPGETTRTVDVAIFGDGMYGVDRDFSLGLSGPSGAVIATGEARGTIREEDAQPALSIADTSASEADGELVFTVSLSAASTLPVAVHAATAGGTATDGVDYTAAAGDLVLDPGQTTVTLSVPVLDDVVFESDEIVLVDLSAPSGATITTGEARGTILDDDAAPTLIIADASASEGGGALVLTVTLAGVTELPATVGYATSDGTAMAGSDYTDTSGSLLFDPGVTSQTITVPLVDDQVYEDDETFAVTLTGPGGATFAGGPAQATIHDDDPTPTVELAVASESQPEDAGTVHLVVTLSGATELPASVPFTVDPSSTAVSPTDYTIAASPLVIPAGATSGAIDVTLVHTPGLDPSKTVVVRLGTPTGASLADPGLTTNTLTIVDIDSPALLTLVRAVTMDVDGDGRIDHYQLVFSKPVDDSTFPGWVANGAGTAQPDFLVLGHDNVVLVNGTAAPVADTPDDEVVYLRFAPSPAPDTDATPDVTTTATPPLVAVDGTSLTPVGAGSVAEEDGAAPVLLAATTETGAASVSLFFSEPVLSAGTCPSASVDPTDLAYTDVSAGGVSGLAAGTDPDGCDGRVALATTPGASTVADLYTDQVAPAAGRLHDVAGNAASTRPVVLTGIIHPYVLDVVSVDQVTLRIDYSEPVDPVAALDLASYSLSASSGCGTPVLSGGVELSEASYELTTSPQSASCTYTLTVTGDVRDLDEDATLVEPRSGTFVGLQPLEVVSATALSLRTFVIDFSKAVMANGTGGANNASYYTLPAALGAVVSAVRYDGVTGKPADASRVLVTHSVDQGSAFYSVLVSTQLLAATGGESLAANPHDRTTFQGLGGDVTSIDQGALFTDPFGDGTTFSFVFVYHGKVYAGPNDQNNAVFRFDPDGSNAITATFSTKSSKTGGPFASFGENLTRPAQAVDNPSGTVTRYYLTPGTDLTAFVPSLSAPRQASVVGCTSVANDKAGALVAASTTEGWVELDNGVAPVPSTSETCQVTLWNDAGPGNFDGIDAFVSADVSGSQHLVYGAHNLGTGIGGGFGELYFTGDTDTLLDNEYCSISTVTLGNTQSLQTIYGWGNSLYVAFASDSVSRQPLFATLRLSSTGGACAGLNDAVVSPNKQIKYLDYLGHNGPHPNTAPNVGIDSMLVFDDGSGPALYVANNGGIARSRDLPPVGTTVWTTVRHDGDGVWSGTTQPIPGIGKLRPGQKGVPQLLAWGNTLFVARNRSDNGAAEVWKWAPPTWTKIVDTSSTAGGMSPNDRRVSMLEVNGGRLYVGFDNAIDGAEVWRTKAGVTAAGLVSQGDLEKVGLSGLGPVGATDLARNKEVISHTTVVYDGKSYLYLTVGCETDFTDGGACDRDPRTGYTDFAIRMFRQVD